jgi:hypothetical protein
MWNLYSGLSPNTNSGIFTIEILAGYKAEYKFLPCNLQNLYSALYPANILMVEALEFVFRLKPEYKFWYFHH